MKIAVVLTPWYRKESPAPELAMTIAILKNQNQEVKLWDINTLMFHDTFGERRFWKHFLLDADIKTITDFQDKTKDLFLYYANLILSDKPDVVIFKCIGKTYDNSINLAQIIKKKDGRAVIIFCGILSDRDSGVDAFVSKQKESPADFIICGDDELALMELIAAIDLGKFEKFDSIFDRQDKIINCLNGPFVNELDSLPFFDFSDFNLNNYRFPDRLELFISKGCPWRCVFCVDWKNEKYRAMGGERIFNEVVYQNNLYKGIKHFRFCDKTINGNIGALSEFCNLVSGALRQGLFQREYFGWSGDAMIRPEMNKELLKNMSGAGCAGIGYGLESGSDRVVKSMGKLFTIPLAEEVIYNTHSVGIKTSLNILVGFPTETRKDFEDTMAFVERNRKSIDEIRITYGGCRVYPNSLLEADRKKYSVVYREEIEENSFNHSIDRIDYWVSQDMSNTYEERVRRTEKISELILSLGIELRVNSRVTKKSKIIQDVQS